MLTFRFTGANGEMIEEEMLAAGMVGKQVQFEFSEEWDGLRKVAVYKAGEACCTTVDVETVDTIPAEVLCCSLQRLQVGIYGISEDGSVVTPTIYATGPFIHISAVMGDDPCFDPENTFWIKLEEAIDTLAKEAVRITAQSLTAAQQAQARKNIGAAGAEEASGSGLDENAAKLLLTILQDGVYAADQSENILRLNEAICGTVLHSVTITLENVILDNPRTLLAEQDSFTTTLAAAEGYEIDTVTVTMGGKDVTAQTYAGGVITISGVTGDVVITAKAKETRSVIVGGVVRGASSFVEGTGLLVNAQNDYRATMIPMGQYLKQGKTYQFSLGSMATTYRYGVQVMTANASNLSFAYVEDTSTSYNTVTSRIVDSGWISADYSYTPTAENLILLVNFKRANDAFISEDDHGALLASFTIQEVEA